MRIIIDIPKEFEEHYKQDKFEDTLQRLSADAHLMAGNYEQETAIMLIQAFSESIPMDRIVEHLNHARVVPLLNTGESYNRGLDFAITQIEKAGGKV